MDTVLTVEQVAEILNLHPKTVRTHIREGRLAAVRTGRQWRIRQADLEAFIEGKDTRGKKDEGFSVRSADPASPAAKVSVSAAVDIMTEGEEDALRLSNSILAVFNSGEPDREGARCDYFYSPDTGRARFLFWGKPEFISSMLKLIAVIHDAAPQTGS
jgi:excisionase family DNA binding protein